MARLSRKSASVSKHNGDKPVTNPVNKTVDVANDLVAAFKQIKPVESIYQEEITPCEFPDIYMYDGIDIVGLPVGNKQAREIVDAALEGDFNVYDVDATKLDKEPACVFNPGSFDIQNLRWEEYVQELAHSAAEALGFGDCEVTAELDGMWLWTENCLWSTPLHSCRSGGNRRTWAAKMLIVLPSAHEGGEITFWGNGGIESVSTAKYKQSMICWHKDKEDLELKPPTKGNRFALLYDLHVPRPIASKQLTACHRRAVQALQDAIEKYTVLVRENTIEETAFFLPLKSRDPLKPSSQGGGAAIRKDILSPSDLAKVDCFSEEGMANIRDFQTHVAFAVLTARDSMRFSRIEGEDRVQRSGTEYTLTDMMDTDGGDNLGEPLRQLARAKFNEASILDADAFKSGVTRIVFTKGETEEHIFRKSMLCLMIYPKEPESSSDSMAVDDSSDSEST